MAGDLARDANLRFMGKAYTEKFLCDTAAAHTIFIGTPMVINQGTDTTHVEPFLDALETKPEDVCVGIAAERVVVALGDPETKEISCYTWPSIVGFENATSALTNEDLGKKCYFSGSGLLSGNQTATDNCEVGTLYRVEDNYAFVRLSTPTVQASAGA